MPRFQPGLFVAKCFQPAHKHQFINALLALGMLIVPVGSGWAQTTSGTTTSAPTVPVKLKKHQAKAPATQPFGAKAFAASGETTLRWLGMGGFFINSRGTNLMIDPLLEGFDMPLLIKFPIAPQDVPRLDAVLVTHADNDHYSVPTTQDLAAVTKVFHSTVYVDSLLQNRQLPAVGHGIGDPFRVGSVQVKLMPADHAYQNAYPGMSKRHFKQEDACGFWLETPDGTSGHRAIHG